MLTYKIRKKIKNSEDGFFKFLKSTYYFFRRFNIPAPKVMWVPIWMLIDSIRRIIHWNIRVFIVTPIFKTICEEVGKGFNASTFLPYVIGKGKIYLGENVKINGKVDFVFGSILEETPEIIIGNNCGFGHMTLFDISGKLKIGDDCLFARDVNFQDCGGHPIDPDLRKAKMPPAKGDVRPITIGNNVWIGTGVHILPGTDIGDNCVIAARTTISRKIPPNHMAYSPKFNVTKIRRLNKMV